MQKKIRTVLFALGILYAPHLVAQINFPEHLLEQSYDSLVSILNNNRRDTLLSQQVASAYLYKARKDKDSTKMARAHERLSMFEKTEKALVHIDSTIYLSRNSTHKNYPTVGYLFKARYLYNANRYEESLDNAIKGYHSAIEKGNITYEIGGLHGMALSNNIWGNHRESLNANLKLLSLLPKSDYYKNRTSRFIAAYGSIGTNYVRLHMPDSALFYFNKAIVLTQKTKDTKEYHDLVERSGAALYLKKEYEAAKDSLTKGYQNGRFVEEEEYTTYPYYMGMIAFEEGKEDEGIAYFQKIDSSYQKDSLLYPELTKVYHKLTNHYKEKNDVENQLASLQRLLNVDSLIDAKNQYVKFKTLKEYDIPNLVREKETLIVSLTQEKGILNNKIQWLIVFLILSGLTGIHYFRKQQLYKKRFQKILADTSQTSNGINEPKFSSTKPKVSEKISERIFQQLQQFEINKEYLDNTINLQNLAKRFDTNTNYLSKTVNVSMGKNFVQYLSDLRLAYATKWLQEDTKARNYTIKAIAQDCGYNTAESFSRAFYKKYGIHPSFFIKQLNKTTP